MARKAILCCNLSLFIGFLLSSTSIANFNITTDTFSLLDLRSQMASDFLTENWTLGSSVCHWHGVTCSSRHQRVVGLNISNMGLEGSIHPSIGNLSFLRNLYLYENKLHGNIPSELANLHRLEVISLAVNNFTGEIPSWISSFPRLQFLSMAGNSFTGSIPNTLCNISTLVSLDVGHNQLYGSIPENIGDLQNLKRLVLQFNRLSGSIPHPLFNISSLETISFTRNGLTGNLSANFFQNFPRLRTLLLSYNELSGQVPTELGESSQLEVLGLSDSMFFGSIPYEIGNLTKLRNCYLGNNKWIGEIPSVIGNMSSLEILDISNTTITGVIPSEIGNLVHLEELYLSYNGKTSGTIPMSIFNISTLRLIELSYSNLSGSLIPPCEYYNLPNLQILDLLSNSLSGNIPDCFSNSSKLVEINLAHNHFSGIIPISFGGLTFIEFLYLGGNNLIADSSLTFISSLTNCLNLRDLQISDNLINGSLPSTIGNFSALINLWADNCGILGRIPHEIGNLSTTIRLMLSNNDFNGSIPTAIRGMRSLNFISLDNNQIEGFLPVQLCEIKNLYVLYLHNNQLTGSMPQCLSNITSLKGLDLSYNMLSSNISEVLFSPTLLELILYGNSFSGSLPQSIGDLDNAFTIDFGRNRLFGMIPNTLSNLKSLTYFSLSLNQFEGHIPESLGNLLSLEHLDLSRNNLVGEIPKSLEKLKYLAYFNVSFNRLTGEVPNGGNFWNFTYASFLSNEGLCSDHLIQLPPCSSPRKSNRRKVPLAVLISIPLVGFVLLLATAGFILITFRNTKKNTQENIPTAGISYKRISHYELQVATNDFNESNLLAAGGFGSVYKGKLFDGTKVAIKVFNLQTEGAFKSFDTECHVMSNLRHRNLTKVISSCSNHNFKALVLEFMPNGSLDKWLYSHNNFLDILKRLDIMIDVASAMEYLHHGYSTPVIHCDLKPSNVLLDENMTGRVSDFGLSKLFNQEYTAQTNTIATIGYIAPEYGLKGLVSTSSDVYSYGILLMETFSRRRPTDDMFAGDLSLKRWIAEFCHDEIIRVVDENMIPEETKKLEATLSCLKSIMELALKCCEELPEERMSMIDTLMYLKKIRREYHHLLEEEIKLLSRYATK